MATTIKLKNGSGAPLAGDLVQGEPALDLTNKRLYTEDSGGTVIEVGTNPSTLTVDTTTLVVDAANNRVGVGTASPSYKFHSVGDALLVHDPDGANTALVAVGAGGTSNVLIDGDTISLRGETGAVQVTKDSSGNVGIASTNTGGFKLDVAGTARANNLVFRADTSTPSGDAAIFRPDSGAVALSTNSTERMRINASGNVGIGTSSPDSRLTVEAPTGDYAVLLTPSGDTTGAVTASYIGFDVRSSTANGPEPAAYIGVEEASTNSVQGHLVFATRQTNNNTVAPTEAMRIDSSGNVNIYGTDDRPLAITSFNTVSAGAGWDLDATSSNGVVTISTAGSERMRVDSSGSLLVGKDVADNTTAGAPLYSGIGSFVNDGARALTVVRKTSDGDLVEFRKDTTTVGSIFSYNGFLGIGSPSGNDAYVLMGSDFVAPATSTGAARDGAIDLGTSGRRFKDLYLSGNVQAGTTSLSGKLQASQSANNILVSYLQHTGTNPFGINIDFNVSNPNNTTNYFIRGEDASAVEFHIWSDGSFVQSSDRRLKDNIVDSGPALETVRSIQVREFDKGEIHHSHGFIAQELAEVYPEVTVPPAERDGDKGAWGVNYPRMVPILVKAIQEQQAMIDELKAEVAALKGA
jgi:hypothetical protein